MKISRPVIAGMSGVAACAIAAARLSATALEPAVEPIAEPQVHFPQPVVVPAADAVAEAPAPEAPAEEAPAPAAAPMPAPAPKPAAPAPAPAEGGAQASLATIEQQVLQEQAGATEEELRNAQPEAAAAAAGAPTPLTVAPKSYKGADQKWFAYATAAPHWEALTVHSESMGRDIPVAVRHATDADGNPVENAPTLYMLNGAGGSEQDSDWLAKASTKVEQVLGGQGVNIVVPMEGAFSYYVDWLTEPQPNTYLHGKQMWSTFLAHELPGSVETYLGANDKRGVLGFSMSATSALLLAEHNPGMFAAVGSFSGCAATSTPLPWFATQLTLERGGATPEQVWGPMGSDHNRRNDALVNAEGLRGTALYVSNASGLAGETDMAGYLASKGMNPAAASNGAATLQVEGGVIEAVTNGCTHDLDAKLGSLGIPATFEYRNTGTHSWPYWLDDLEKSWTQVLGPALRG